MSSDTAISIRGLSKAYTIKKGGLEKQSTLAETMLSRARNPFKRSAKETFHALTDINIEVKKGDVLGIIGRNGAGKSTLLKTLSRITYPTTGEVDIYGRVGSLLEVGTGFHPELTGRENIFLNGTILGMTRPEIKQEFDAIVQFAGVERFLETPVKRYSSGMYVRLAFAVAAHMRTEVLIVDEVLAVGDADFQSRCVGKMQDVAKNEGRTVLFVSHQLQTVRALCPKTAYLKDGKVVCLDETDRSINRYLQSAARDKPLIERDVADKNGVLLKSATPIQNQFMPHEPKIIDFEVHCKGTQSQKFFLGILIRDQKGSEIAHIDSRYLDGYYPSDQNQSIRLCLNSPWLSPGDYSVDIAICDSGVLDRVENACRISVSEEMPYASAHGTSRLSVISDFDIKPVTIRHRNSA